MSARRVKKDPHNRMAINCSVPQLTQTVLEVLNIYALIAAGLEKIRLACWSAHPFVYLLLKATQISGQIFLNYSLQF